MFSGFCSLVRPQVNFNPEYDDLPFNVKMFGPKPKGKENVQTYTWRIKPGAKVFLTIDTYFPTIKSYYQKV